MILSHHSLETRSGSILPNPSGLSHPLTQSSVSLLDGLELSGFKGSAATRQGALGEFWKDLSRAEKEPHFSFQGQFHNFQIASMPELNETKTFQNFYKPELQERIHLETMKTFHFHKMGTFHSDFDIFNCIFSFIM